MRLDVDIWPDVDLREMMISYVPSVIQSLHKCSRAHKLTAGKSRHEKVMEGATH